MNVVEQVKIRKRNDAWTSLDNNDSSTESGMLPPCFYDVLPNKVLELDDFERLAVARLKVLRKIEELKIRNIVGDKFNKQLKDTLKANLTDPHIDNTSHFILLAAHSWKDDLRSWFVTHETFLFRFRLEYLVNSANKNDHLLKFLERFQFDEVSKEEKLQHMNHLQRIPIIKNRFDTSFSSNNDSSDSLISPSLIKETHYFKIPFHEASDLVANRRCFLSKGYAYVPIQDIISIVTAKFRMSLSKSLGQASRSFHTVCNEYSHLSPILHNIGSAYIGNKFDQSEVMENSSYTLTAQTVDSYTAHMPLCMSQLHAGLKQDHKLRHNGRLQYGLFLKGANMSMEESLIFFQKEFTHIMTAEKFQKEYTYNVRHMYGKEGKRSNYPPYNCMKIIMGNPPQTSGDHHGCPFRHYDENHLSALLTKMKIGTPQDRTAILDLKKAKHYQLACLKHFEVMHPHPSKEVDMTGVGQHPNAWFSASVNYRNANGK
jgi:DNA primase large subunit